MHFEQKITLECVLSFQTNLSPRRLTISGFPQMSKKKNSNHKIVECLQQSLRNNTKAVQHTVSHHP